MLGLKLKPYSLGHSLLLERFGSPYAVGGRIGVEDLLFGVLVCSNTFEDNLALLDSQEMWSLVAKWRRKVFRRCFGLLPRRIALGEKFTLFADYIADGMTRPKVFVKQSNGREQGAPIEATLAVVLMKELGLTFSEVMNAPAPLCWWHYVTLAELNDRATIFDQERHQELTRLADEFDAKIRKGAN